MRVDGYVCMSVGGKMYVGRWMDGEIGMWLGGTACWWVNVYGYKGI